MASHESSDVAARKDALVCRSGELLLRARGNAGVGAEDWALDVGRLLSAVRVELESDPEFVPTTVRGAAVRLAEHLMQRRAIPAARYAVDGNEPVERGRANRRESAGIDHRSGIPFAPSIRLGRMG